MRGSGNLNGAVQINTGGSIAPGFSPACLTTGDLNLSAGGNLQMEVAGTTACVQSDLISVTGNVTLAGSLTVGALNGYSPMPLDAIIIIENDGTDAVSGTFTGLPEDATVMLGGIEMHISYIAGDGNDVRLVRKADPIPEIAKMKITQSFLRRGMLMR